MGAIRIPNIDEHGNFVNPDVLARLAEKLAGGGGTPTGGITAATTLDEAAAQATTNGA